MFSTNIYVDEDRYNELLKGGFDISLGYHFWRMAIEVAPRDTGNLQRSIRLRNNTKKHIRVGYDLSTANYAKFLEVGVGPVKKYKGFISKDTRIVIYEQLLGWLIKGDNPIYTTRPYVKLEMSSNAPFSWERAIMKQAKINSNFISANNRMKISQIRDLEYRKRIGMGSSSAIGGRTSQTKNYGKQRGTSQLEQILQERKKQTKLN